MIAVPLPFLLSGYSFAFSHTALLGTVDMPVEVSTAVLKTAFRTGAQIVPAGAIISSAASAYLAYAFPGPQRSLWALAAAASVSPLVFTRLIMYPGIQRAVAISNDKALQTKAAASEEHKPLLNGWIMQNYVRVGMFLVASVTAMRASAYNTIALV